MRAMKLRSGAAPGIWNTVRETLGRAIVLATLISLGQAAFVDAQQTTAQGQQPSTQAGPPAQQPEASPDEGGPGGDNGVIALPKKKETEAPSLRHRRSPR